MSPRLLALLAGLLAAAPALHGGWVTGSIPTDDALARTGVGLVGALVAGHLLQRLVAGYAALNAADDAPAEDGAAEDGGVPARTAPARRAGDPRPAPPSDPLGGTP